MEYPPNFALQEDKISNLWIEVDTNSNPNVTNIHFSHRLNRTLRDVYQCFAYFELLATLDISESYVTQRVLNNHRHCHHHHSLIFSIWPQTIAIWLCMKLPRLLSRRRREYLGISFWVVFSIVCVRFEFSCNWRNNVSRHLQLTRGEVKESAGWLVLVWAFCSSVVEHLHVFEGQKLD